MAKVTQTKTTYKRRVVRSRDGDGDGRYNESRDQGGYSRHDDRGQLMQKLEEMQRKIDKMS